MHYISVISLSIYVALKFFFEFGAKLHFSTSAQKLGLAIFDDIFPQKMKKLTIIKQNNDMQDK